jgi:hypothetical protein
MLPRPEIIRERLASAAEGAAALEPLGLKDSEPLELRPLLPKWEFGGYGWTSPTNLLLTAAWVKWLDPDQDVCKIWSRNDGGVISGGYSIRSMDERFTVPLIQHLGIAPGFCSPNSGMQGSRALEKSRQAERLDSRFKIRQRVRFDLDLLIRVMNVINDLSPTSAMASFQTLLGVGKWMKAQRAALQVRDTRVGDSASTCVASLTTLAASAEDPQLVTIVSAGVLRVMFSSSSESPSLEIRGCESAMTSANARSGALGDFEVWSDGQCLLAAEAKGSSIQFGVGDLRRALDRGGRKTGSYLLVTAAAQPWSTASSTGDACREVLSEASELGLQIAVVTVRDILVMCLALPGVTPERIYKSINEQIAKSPSLRTDALSQWRRMQVYAPKPE